MKLMRIHMVKYEVITNGDTTFINAVGPFIGMPKKLTIGPVCDKNIKTICALLYYVHTLYVSRHLQSHRSPLAPSKRRHRIPDSSNPL